MNCFSRGRGQFSVKVDADRILQTFVFVWDLVLIDENELRSTLNPITFLSAINWYLRDKKSGRSDLHPPLRDPI